MPESLIPFLATAFVCSSVAAVFYGIAACIREIYEGRSRYLRAKRGDPEIPRHSRALARPGRPT